MNRNSDGCDLFGPFAIKNGRREVKRYAMIYTCLTSKAVHLEVVFSLSTDSFLNSFRRFVAIHGQVQELKVIKEPNLLYILLYL